MRPASSTGCSHPDNEWCDDCYLPARHLPVLRDLDDNDDLEDAYLAALHTDPFPRALPRWAGERCLNKRHSHGERAYKDACLDTAVPPYPFIHRAVAAAAVGAVLGTCAGIAAAYWLAERATQAASTAGAVTAAGRTLAEHRRARTP